MADRSAPCMSGFPRMRAWAQLVSHLPTTRSSAVLRDRRDIPAFVGPGMDGFSPNQSLCLPQLAPVPTSSSPLAFTTYGLHINGALGIDAVAGFKRVRAEAPRPLCSARSPGHCANNDPQSFRVAAPYFTYRMEP